MAPLDPRKVLVTWSRHMGYQRRHYDVVVAAETPIGLVRLYSADVELWRSGHNKPNALREGRAWAAANGLPLVEGLHTERHVRVPGSAHGASAFVRED